MTPKTRQPLYPYSVNIETATGKPAILSVALLTPKQAEELQVEFKEDRARRGCTGCAHQRAATCCRRLRQGAARSQGMLAESGAQSCITQYWGYDLRELGNVPPHCCVRGKFPGV